MQLKRNLSFHYKYCFQYSILDIEMITIPRVASLNQKTNNSFANDHSCNTAEKFESPAFSEQKNRNWHKNEKFTSRSNSQKLLRLLSYTSHAEQGNLEEKNRIFLLFFFFHLQKAESRIKLLIVWVELNAACKFKSLECEW